MAARTARSLRVRDPDARERLAALLPQVAPGALAGERTIEVDPVLHALLPNGLSRGSSVLCAGGAAASMAFLLVAAATRSGSWLGVAGLPTFGVDAAREAGVALERVLQVRDGGPTDVAGDERCAQVLGGLVDGFDLILFGAAAQVRPATARRAQARVQARGAVLVLVGDDASTAAGAFSTDVRLTSRSTWQGISDGHGHLRARRVDLAAEGRRMHGVRRHELWFPDVHGAITPATPTGTSVPLRRTG